MLMIHLNYISNVQTQTSKERKHKNFWRVKNLALYANILRNCLIKLHHFNFNKFYSKSRKKIIKNLVCPEVI